MTGRQHAEAAELDGYLPESQPNMVRFAGLPSSHLQRSREGTPRMT
ncbi:MAG: hypothetical protein ACH36H_09995 [Candidatus Nanopelagicales bacterium]